MPLQRILIPDGSPQPAQITQACEAIAAGSCVVMPTETVYGFAVDPKQGSRIEALRALKGRPPEQPFTHHLAAAENLLELVPPPSPRVMRLVERFWPGPLTLILKDHGGQDIGVRVPAHAFTQQVIHRLGHDLLLTSVNPSGEPALTDPQAIIDRFGEHIDFLFDGGPSPQDHASTVLRCTDPQFEVLREGALGSPEVLREASQLILFVCTGNTCRSPMAEGIAISRAAGRLGVEAGQLLARGLEFASAGTCSYGRATASEGSFEAASEIGIDLSKHRAQMLSNELIERARRIFCLSGSHLAVVSSLLAADSEKAELLDPSQAVPDPIGGGLDLYRRTRDQIAQALDGRMAEILGLLAEG